MAPATLSRPLTAGQELQEVLIETDEEGEIQSPPIYPNSHEDEVKKLKKKLRDLGEQHNTLLDNAKNNAKIAQNRIEALEKKVADLAEIAELLGKIAENSQKLNAFGIMDEKRMAEMKIRQLKQRGSAADYLAEYHYQAAKLNWGEEAYMA
ncbi:hypothetical protein ACKAV7_011858 [Fusarium commune]